MLQRELLRNSNLVIKMGIQYRPTEVLHNGCSLRLLVLFMLILPGYVSESTANKTCILTDKGETLVASLKQSFTRVESVSVDLTFVVDRSKSISDDTYKRSVKAIAYLLNYLIRNDWLCIGPSADAVTILYFSNTTILAYNSK